MLRPTEQPQIQISDETRLAYARTYFARSVDECRAEAKETIRLVTRDIIREMITRTVAGPLAFAIYAEKLARHCA